MNTQSLSIKPVQTTQMVTQPLSNKPPEPKKPQSNSTVQNTHLQLIPNQQIELGKKLGEGGFGVVYKGVWNAHEVAIKTLLVKDLTDDLEKSFFSEANIMARLNHPAVIRLYGISKHLGAYSMILEFMTGGDLYHLLADKKQALPWNPIRWQLAIDIGAGLSYLHVNNILHRDLKSLNILLDDKYRTKITDFGLSKLKNQSSSVHTKNIAGSVAWMAPELLQRRAKITKAADVYAYGMILWEISSRKIPFSDQHNQAVIMQWIKEGEREDIPKKCPKAYAKVIQDCWKGAVEDRPSIEGALKALKAACPEKKLAVEEVFKKLELSNMSEKIEKTSPKKDLNAGKEVYLKGLAFYEKSRFRDALPHLEKAAEAGYPSACLILHLLYDSSGYIGPKNPVIADKWKQKIDQQISWFKQQAATKDPYAQLLYGYCFDLGIGMEIDFAQAVKYYRLAAEQGEARAQCCLGRCYETGSGVEKDLSQAAKYYQLAAEQGLARAQWYLALCCDNGEGVEKNPGLGWKYLVLAVNQGFARAQHSMGSRYGQAKDYLQAVKLYRLAADQGYSPSQNNLGAAYYHGRGVEKNFNLAIKYYKFAANQGNNTAQYNLGKMYYDGIGMEKNPTQAVKYLKLAADQGYASAQFQLGWCYSSGFGVLKNHSEQAKYFLLAANQGNVSAQRNLGICYWKGEGVEEDLRLGYKYLKQAADQGDADALYSLGQLYHHKQISTSGSPFRSHSAAATHYYRLAISKGNMQAKRDLQTLKTTVGGVECVVS